MSNNMKIYQPYFPRHPVTSTKNDLVTNSQPNVSFQDLLSEQLQSKDQIKFSAHAKDRLEKRGIDIDSILINDISQAMNKAEKKGARDSLILTQNIAFVVNVPNRTVITAVDEQSMKEHIFTNIDSAIII